MYKIANFDNLENVGVILRGKSIYSLERYADGFDHCFIVGQHENSLKQIGQFIKGKKIVQICNKVVMKVPKGIADEYNIQDIQLNYNGKHDDDRIGGTKLRLFNDCVKNNPWAKVHLAPAGIKGRKAIKHWETTGLYGIDVACFFRPKNIHIFGLDFYIVDYFCRERKQIKNSSARSGKMIKNLRLMCQRDKDIIFHVYTCHHGLEELNNLKVVKV